MVGKLISAMNRQIRGLHEAAYLLALFTFFSQVLALIRDRTFAHFFGADAILDAYFAAFRIPDLVFAFLTLFISSYAVIPLIAERGGAKTDTSRELIGSVLAVFGALSIFSAFLLYALAPALVPLLFPGFNATLAEQVVTLTRIMLLQPILLGISSIAASVMQSSQKFFLFALAPIFYNLGIIVGALFLYPSLGVSGLAWGVVLGAALHLLIQSVPALWYDQMLFPRLPRRVFYDVKKVVLLSLPRALALSAQQVLLLVFVGVASLTALGGVSVFSFAFNLQSVPLSIIGASYAAALFPSLSLLYAKGDNHTFVREVWSAVRHSIFWIMPAIILMVVLRAHIVRVILGTGAFTWSDTRLTAAILAGFVISLVAQSSILIFSRGFYAAGRSWEPIIVNVSAALVAAGAAWLSVLWFKGASFSRFFLEDLFRISGIPGSEVIMIALAYSAVMLTAAFVLAYLFARRFGFEGRVVSSLLFSFAASVIGGASAYGVLQLTGPLLPTDTFFGIFAQGAAAGIVGILAWILVLLILRSQDFREVITVFYRLVLRQTGA